MHHIRTLKDSVVYVDFDGVLSKEEVGKAWDILNAILVTNIIRIILTESYQLIKRVTAKLATESEF